ncbi:hypothetical protein ACIQNT_04520 [Streptomyces luteogriseus]|uniref:Uncharacterized protein n=1 Tax=Streptomyces luteogriseus TaxID=68233 RepID=A0A7W7DK15_9ACTN|nr:hypothetical protein [Streptomyces luteogriseus]MBB4711075.1 hypothetical protein [Streptomyces luteogriseus]
MPSRAGGPYGSRTGRGRTRVGGGGARATDGGAHATESAARAVGRGARAVGTGTRVLDRAGTGVGGAWAAGIPAASTSSSALRLHVPAPVP